MTDAEIAALRDELRLPGSRGPEIVARLRARLALVEDAMADPEISPAELDRALAARPAPAEPAESFQRCDGTGNE